MKLKKIKNLNRGFEFLEECSRSTPVAGQQSAKAE